MYIITINVQYVCHSAAWQLSIIIVIIIFIIIMYRHLLNVTLPSMGPLPVFRPDGTTRKVVSP
jgi:hypothetical protein